MYSYLSQHILWNCRDHRPHSLLDKVDHIKCLPNDTLLLLYHKLMCAQVLFWGNHILYCVDIYIYIYIYIYIHIYIYIIYIYCHPQLRILLKYFALAF